MFNLRNADFTPPIHQRGAGFYHSPLWPRAQGYVQHKEMLVGFEAAFFIT